MSEEAKKLLLNYYNLVCDSTKHPSILKDQTCLLYLAYIIDTDDIEVIQLALDTLNKLVENHKNAPTLKNSYGLLEALETVKIRFRESEPQISERIQNMLNQIRSCASPIQILQNCSGEPYNSRKLRVYELYVQGLNEATKNQLEKAMVNIRGVVSLVLDTQHQRMTTRVTSNVTPKIIAEHIVQETSMQLMLIKRNALKQEVFLNLLGTPEERGDGIDMPAYLPEDDTPPRGDQVLSTKHRKRPVPISVFRWIAKKWQKSFYW